MGALLGAQGPRVHIAVLRDGKGKQAEGIKGHVGPSGNNPFSHTGEEGESEEAGETG